MLRNPKFLLCMAFGIAVLCGAGLLRPARAEVESLTPKQDLDAVMSRLREIKQAPSPSNYDLMIYEQRAGELLATGDPFGLKRYEEALVMFRDALARASSAARPTNTIGPPVAYLVQQIHYGIGKASLGLYNRKIDDFYSHRPPLPPGVDPLAPENVPPEARSKSAEAEVLLGEAIAASGEAIADEKTNADSVWRPDSDQLLRTRLNLFKANWLLRRWHATFAAAKNVYQILYEQGPLQAAYSAITATQARQDLKGVVTAYLGDVKLHGPEVVVSDEEFFEALQWAYASEEIQSLDLMSARIVAGSRDGSKLRDVQEALAIAQETEKRLQALIGSKMSAVFARQAPASIIMEPDQNVAALNEERRASLAQVEAARKALDNANPEIFGAKTATIPDIQSRLRAGQALLFLYVGDVDSIVWAVTKTNAGYAIAKNFTRLELKQQVEAIRQTVQIAGRSRDSLLPFDVAAAHQLYAKLIDPVRSYLSGVEDLLVVESPELRAVPIGLLVTTLPEPALSATPDYSHVAWLLREYSITVLPTAVSIGSLETLRQREPAPKEFFAVADPVLSGDPKKTPDLCALRPPGSSVALVDAVRNLRPLPDTSEEVQAIAQDLPRAKSEILRRADATKTAVKRAPLQDFKILYFATHALLPYERVGCGASVTDAAIVLTPPIAATPADDGLLTASEIMHLNLDADLVVLSGCDTAGPGGTSAEGLSGLARAFFFAGARSVVVSNWAVDSQSTVSLMRLLFKSAMSKEGASVAAALRAAALAVLNHPAQPYWSHPAFWASFSVVGDGGAARLGKRKP